jgi:WD40 repeat protein
MSFERPYKLLHDLTSAHADSIRALAFSPKGDLLASAGDDATLTIWDPAKGSMLYQILMGSPVICVTWDPRKNSTTVLCGCENGAAYILSNFSKQEEAREVLTGLDAPVYAIAIDPASGVLALGIGVEVQITSEIGGSGGNYSTSRILSKPPELLQSTSSSKDLWPRSLHFLKGGNRLIVSYLNHGIVCWDVRSGIMLWQIKPDSPRIGYSSISRDQRFLLVSNLRDGMDLYKIGQPGKVVSFRQAAVPEKNYPMNTHFLHNDRAVVCGSPTGKVGIWDTLTGGYLQTLYHDGTWLF